MKELEGKGNELREFSIESESTPEESINPVEIDICGLNITRNCFEQKFDFSRLYNENDEQSLSLVSIKNKITDINDDSVFDGQDTSFLKRIDEPTTSYRDLSSQKTNYESQNGSTII